MSPDMDRPAFERGIAGLDGGEFVRFVAAVYASQESVASVDREGGVLVVRGRNPRRILPVVDRPGPFRGPVPHGEATGPVDEVVAQVDHDRARARATRHDAHYRAPSDLYARVRNGLDPEVGARLLDDHLDLRAGRDADRTRRRRTAAVVLLTALVVVGGLAASAVPVDSPRDAPSPAATATRTTSGVPTAPPGDPYPPGVHPGGVRDADALARAHATAVRDRYYRWTVVTWRTRALTAGIGVEAAGPREVLRAMGDGPESARGNASIRNYSDGNYSSVGITGPNGTEYVRETVRRPPGDDGWFADRAAAYVARYLSGDRGDVAPVDAAGLRVYRLTVRTPPDRLDDHVTNYLATAVVTREGFVLAFDVTYRRYGSGSVSTVAIRFRYGTYSGTPDPPPWVEAARAATNGTPTTGIGAGD